jgi:hypothetical protein
MGLPLSLPGANALLSKTMARPGRLQGFLTACGVLWLCVVGAGLWVVWDYENRPGAAAHPPAQWPSDSHIARTTDRPTLVMLAHPYCSCTRASIGELAVLMAQARTRPQAYVLFLKPPGFSDDWEKSPLWHSAASIPNVTVVRDDDGLEARRFDAATSGQTMLYDVTGRLLFSGGITGSRGHSGDNAGRAAILALLHHDAPGRTGSLVFGCPLFAPGNPCQSQETRHHVLTPDE